MFDEYLLVEIARLPYPLKIETAVFVAVVAMFVDEVYLDI